MAEVKDTVIEQEADTPEVVETKDTCAARIHQLLRNVCHDTIQIGFELLKAKKLVKRGEWGKWLKAEFAWTQRTANNFMRIAERFGNWKTFSNLGYSRLQAMLALPEGNEQEFIDEQELAGHPVETQSVRELKKSVKTWNHRAEQITTEEVMAGEPEEVSNEEFPIEDSTEDSSADTEEQEEESSMRKDDKKWIAFENHKRIILEQMARLILLAKTNKEEDIAVEIYDYFYSMHDHLMKATEMLSEVIWLTKEKTGVVA